MDNIENKFKENNFGEIKCTESIEFLDGDDMILSTNCNEIKRKINWYLSKNGYMNDGEESCHIVVNDDKSFNLECTYSSFDMAEFYIRNYKLEK